MIRRYIINNPPKFDKCFSRSLAELNFFNDSRYFISLTREINKLPSTEVHHFVVVTQHRRISVDISKDEYKKLEHGAESSLKKVITEISIFPDVTHPIVIGIIHDYYTCNPPIILLEICFQSENGHKMFQFPEWIGEDVTGIADYDEFNMANNRR